MHNNAHQHHKILDTNRKNILCLAAICFPYQYFYGRAHARCGLSVSPPRQKTPRSIHTSMQHNQILDIYTQEKILRLAAIRAAYQFFRMAVPKPIG